VCDTYPKRVNHRVLSPGIRRNSISRSRAFSVSPAALEFGSGLVAPAELDEQVATNAGEEMVIAQGGLVGDLVQQFEAGLGAEGHAEGDGAVELDDGGGAIWERAS
jgi:hypothetical protein